MECKKCGGKIFWIEKKECCDECEYNAAYDDDDDEYIWDAKEINRKELIRNYVMEEGECWFDEAWGIGCYMMTCPSCGRKWNIPLTDS